jgi:hypothetical protein
MMQTTRDLRSQPEKAAPSQEPSGTVAMVGRPHHNYQQLDGTTYTAD